MDVAEDLGDTMEISTSIPKISSNFFLNPLNPASPACIFPVSIACNIVLSLDIEPMKVDEKEYIRGISNLIMNLKEKSIRAVPSCDFEDDIWYIIWEKNK